jgi:hypothetical protein
MVERYNIYPYDQYSTDDRKSPAGDWVRYEDYQALQAERDAAVDRAKEASQYLAIETRHAEIAEAQLAKAREFIEYVSFGNSRDYTDNSDQAAAILALLDTPTPSPSPDALVKAAEMMVRAYREESDKVITAFYALENALAAMKGGEGWNGNR